jgi:hypothetical protein
MLILYERSLHFITSKFGCPKIKELTFGIVFISYLASDNNNSQKMGGFHVPDFELSQND